MDCHGQIGEEDIASIRNKTITIPKRRVTNRYFLLLQIICFVVLIILINYCFTYGDLKRIINGYDSCRNICGKVNNMNDERKKSWCDGLDMTYRKYLLVFKPDGRNHYNATRLYERHNDVVVPITLRDNVQRVCLVNCSVYQHYNQYKNRCILNKRDGVADIFWGKSGISNFFLEVAEDIVTYWPEILFLSGISLVLSVTMTILFRFFIKIAIWLVLIGLMLVCFATTIYTWVMWNYWKNIIKRPEYLASELEMRRWGTYLVFAVLDTAFTICALVVTFIVKKRIGFIARLFRETRKAISAVPLIIFQPLVTISFIGAVVATWIYFFLWIETSGHEKELYDDFYEYQKDNWMYLARWYNTFVALWSIEFLMACQHATTAGAVIVWYFANEKNVLGSPIFYGLYNLVRYHVGSISCGSLFISIAQILNASLNIFKKYSTIHHTHTNFCNFFTTIKMFLDNLTRNAYVMIAFYGDSIYVAGKTATEALKSNPFNLGEINSMGHLILFLGKIVISKVIILVGIVIFQEIEDLQHAWVLIILSGWIAYLICNCFLSLFAMVMDSTFLCFCEDYQHNHGISQTRSYVTHELLKYIVNTKRSDNVLVVENYRDYVHQN